MFRTRKGLMAHEEGSLAYILVRDSIVYSFMCVPPRASVRPPLTRRAPASSAQS